MLKNRQFYFSAGAALLTFSLIGSTTAQAEDSRGGAHNLNRSTNGADVDGNRLSAETSYRGLIVEKEGSSGDGVIEPVEESGWDPPACYYAPKWTPSEFEEHRTGGNLEERLEHLDEANAEGIREYYSEGFEDTEFDDYKLDKEGEGAWWGTFINSDANPGRLAYHACAIDSPFWADHGDVPDYEEVPDQEYLAELAYAHVDIPEIEVELNPEDAQTVGLDTWIWVGAADLEPVSVTARLDGFEGLSSTVTATPVRLEVDPGTEDAEVLHGAEGCAVGADGSVGEPYESERMDETPPCGVTYLRATHADGPYTMTAALTWEISWEGSDGDGGDLPDGQFETTQEITVQEVQSIVRQG